MSRAILVLMMLASVFSVVTSAPASTNNQPGSTVKQEQKPKNNQATQEQTTRLPQPPYKKEEETDGDEDIKQLEREIDALVKDERLEPSKKQQQLRKLQSELSQLKRLKATKIETSLQKALAFEESKFKPCRYYTKNGYCMFDDDCKFSHTLPREKRSNKFTRASRNMGFSQVISKKLYGQNLMDQLITMRMNHAHHLQYGEPLKPISKRLKERILQYQIPTLVNYERIETVATALPQPISLYSSLFIQ